MKKSTDPKHQESVSFVGLKSEKTSLSTSKGAKSISDHYGTSGIDFKRPGLRPFWKPYTGETSRRLWSCIAINLLDLQLNYLTLFSVRRKENSRFTVRAKSTRSPQCLWQITKENEEREADPDESMKEKKKSKISKSKAKKTYRLPQNRKVRVYSIPFRLKWRL